MPPFVTRKGRIFWAPRKTFTRRLMPYGIWTCVTGEEFLFDRDYSPICMRAPKLPPVLCPAGQWVHWQTQNWFYDDGTPEKEKLAVAEKTLHEWGMYNPVMAQIETMLGPKRGRPRRPRHAMNLGPQR